MLRKLASMSPPKDGHRQNYGEESKEAGQSHEHVVEKIVDLLEKRNLINSKQSTKTKPRVNQLLHSLLKAHLKNPADDESNINSNSQTERNSQSVIKGDIENSRTPAFVREEDKQADLSTERHRINQNRYLVIDPSKIDKSKQGGEPASTVYLGSSARRMENPSSQIQDVPSEEGLHAQVSKQPRKLNKCKRTPVFKYPHQNMTKQERADTPNQHSDEKKHDEDYGSETNNQAAAAVVDQGEMTSPDELYYVNTNNAGSAAKVISRQSSARGSSPNTSTSNHKLQSSAPNSNSRLSENNSERGFYN